MDFVNRIMQRAVGGLLPAVVAYVFIFGIKYIKDYFSLRRCKVKNMVAIPWCVLIDLVFQFKWPYEFDLSSVLYIVVLIITSILTYQDKFTKLSAKVKTKMDADKFEQECKQKVREVGMKVVRSVYVKSGNGLTEIDLVAISKKGIFVIECKNYHGLIQGWMEDAQWKITKYRYNKEYRNGEDSMNQDVTTKTLHSPYIQNKRHIQRLCEEMGIPQESVVNVILFSNKSDIKGIRLSKGAYVMKLWEVKEKMKQIEDERIDMLSKRDINHLYREFRKRANISQKKKWKHLNSIQAGKEYDFD